MRWLFTFALTLCALPALAQTEPILVRISAGTGFFINQQGQLITNAHVVRNCQSISVKMADGEHVATLTAADNERDLALLQVNGAPPGVADLRWNIRDIHVGDEVVVLGFPGSQGVEGHYVFRKTHVLGLNGPTGEPQWLQLETVAQHGNSGGPVLDAAGNVIGVVTGNAMTYRTLTSNGQPLGSPELVGKSDIAITLPVLESFLNAQHAYYNQAASGLVMHADEHLEAEGLRFIAPVRCYLGPH